LSLRYLYYKNEQYNENQQEFDISLAFNKLKLNCLTNTSDNCFEEITQIRAYCKKISINENARAKIFEISDDVIKYENTEITISQLSVFFHTLIKKAKSILYEDLLLMNENEVKSLILINNVKDSLNEKTVNFNFIDYITKIQDLSEKDRFYFQLYMFSLQYKVKIRNKLHIRLDFDTELVVVEKKGGRKNVKSEEIRGSWGGLDF